MIEVRTSPKDCGPFVETAEAPAGYCADSTPISVYVDTTDGDKRYTVTATNYELPSMQIIKTDVDRRADPRYGSGEIRDRQLFHLHHHRYRWLRNTFRHFPAGVYVVREERRARVMSPHEQTVALRPANPLGCSGYQKPGFAEILKKNIATGEPIEGRHFPYRADRR